MKRGYHVHTLFHRILPKTEGMLSEFQAKHPLFSYAKAKGRKDRWVRYLFLIRVVACNRRYLLVTGQSEYYRKRYRKFLPPRWQNLFNSRVGQRIIKNIFFGALLSLGERLIPANRLIGEHITSFVPIAVLASPVNRKFLSSDTEYLKAAKALGIPTFLPVMTWDNLTTKTHIPVVPDRLLVWNKLQVLEALEHHGIRASRTAIIGAPVFDSWFSHLRRPLPREEFCRVNGLNPDFPILLYLGSSGNIAKDETWLIKNVRAALDSSPNPKLKGTQIIVRPHPANDDIYRVLEGVPYTFVLPKKGALPHSSEKMDFFYNCLYHSVCSVGVNTSAMIDAVIARRPIVAILTDTYEKTQSAAEHFKQLVAYGAIECVKDADQLVVVVGNLLNGGDQKMDAREHFVNDLIRPNGIDTSAGESTARAIEAFIA